MLYDRVLKYNADPAQFFNKILTKPAERNIKTNSTTACLVLVSN